MTANDAIYELYFIRRAAHCYELIDTLFSRILLFDSTNVRRFIDIHDPIDGAGVDVGLHLHSMLPVLQKEVFMFMGHLFEIADSFKDLLDPQKTETALQSEQDSFKLLLQKFSDLHKSDLDNSGTNAQSSLRGAIIDVFRTDSRIKQLAQLSDPETGIKSVRSRAFSRRLSIISAEDNNLALGEIERVLDSLPPNKQKDWLAFNDFLKPKISANSADSVDREALLHLFALNLSIPSGPIFQLYTTRTTLIDICSDFYPFENSDGRLREFSFSSLYLRTHHDIYHRLLKDFSTVDALISALASSSSDINIDFSNSQRFFSDFPKSEAFLEVFFKKRETVGEMFLRIREEMREAVSLPPLFSDRIDRAMHQFFLEPEQRELSELLSAFVRDREANLNKSISKLTTTFLRSTSERNSSYPRAVFPPLFKDLNFAKVVEISKMRSSLPIGFYVSRLMEQAVAASYQNEDGSTAQEYFSLTMQAYAFALNGLWTACRISSIKALRIADSEDCAHEDQISGREASYFHCLALRMESGTLESLEFLVPPALLDAKRRFQGDIGSEFNGARILAEEINYKVTRFLMEYFYEDRFDQAAIDQLKEKEIEYAFKSAHKCPVEGARLWVNISLISSLFSLLLLELQYGNNFPSKRESLLSKDELNKISFRVKEQINNIRSLFHSAETLRDVVPIRDAILLVFAAGICEYSDEVIQDLENILYDEKKLKEFEVYRFDAPRVAAMKDLLAKSTPISR